MNGEPDSSSNVVSAASFGWDRSGSLRESQCIFAGVDVSALVAFGIDRRASSLCIGADFTVMATISVAAQDLIVKATAGLIFDGYVTVDAGSVLRLSQRTVDYLGQYLFALLPASLVHIQSVCRRKYLLVAASCVTTALSSVVAAHYKNQNNNIFISWCCAVLLPQLFVSIKIILQARDARNKARSLESSVCFYRLRDIKGTFENDLHSQDFASDLCPEETDRATLESNCRHVAAHEAYKIFISRVGLPCSGDADKGMAAILQQLHVEAQCKLRWAVLLGVLSISSFVAPCVLAQECYSHKLHITLWVVSGGLFSVSAQLLFDHQKLPDYNYAGLRSFVENAS